MLGNPQRSSNEPGRATATGCPTLGDRSQSKASGLHRQFAPKAGNFTDGPRLTTVRFSDRSNQEGAEKSDSGLKPSQPPSGYTIKIGAVGNQQAFMTIVTDSPQVTAGHLVTVPSYGGAEKRDRAVFHATAAATPVVLGLTFSCLTTGFVFTAVAASRDPLSR